MHKENAVEYRYGAVKLNNGDMQPDLLLFAASAIDIETWAGVPQKKKIEENETVGFQRALDDRRLNSLSDFFNDQDNVIQNPLLCATREPKSHIHFEKAIDNGRIATGELVISVPDLDNLKLLPLLEMLIEILESRVPELKGAQVNNELLNKLRRRINSSLEEITDDEEEEDLERDQEERGVEAPEEYDDVLASDESHILEFWQEIKARIHLIKECAQEDCQEFLGFNEEAVKAYLKPIMLVDGQHRLSGAIASAKYIAEHECQDELVALLENGMDKDQALRQIMAQNSRWLPISLLVTDDPAEQVFQFVIVNQKATPVDKALLATIVSASLSNEELSRISDRLESSGIHLDESRAAVQLIRDEDSPFHGKVQRGLSEESDVLAYNVFLTLTKAFRNLRGAQYFHDEKNKDWAKIWRLRCLESCRIVADFDAKGFANKYEYWASRNGPWQWVFKAFWSAVRDSLGSESVNADGNYWGAPRSSNLYNKPMLMTLATDFFQWLSTNEECIDSSSNVSTLVSRWLKYTDKKYFAREWDFAGNKKDAPGIRRRISYEWVNYREDPNPDKRVPKATSFGKPFNRSGG